MDLNHKFCTICNKRHISKPSKEWCSVCNQAFCKECNECHGLMTTTENHLTIPITSYDGLRLSLLSIGTTCEDHTERYELYCQTHEKLLCLTCIEEHSECKDIKSIKKIAKNIKNSESFNEVRMSIEDMDTNIDKMILEIQSNQNSANDCRGIIIQRIRNIREKINKHLDTLEIRLKEELSQLETKAENDIQGTLKHLEEKKVQNASKQKQMEDITQYASDLQTFIGLRHLSSKIATDEAFFQSSIESGRFDKVEIAFELDENINDFSNINKFGSVQLQKIPSSLQFDSQKGKQAQTIEIRKSIENIVVKFIDSLQVNTSGESIYGCDFLPDGNMVFCNYSSNKNSDSISVFASNGSYLDKILLISHYAFDIVSLDEKTVAVISDKPGSSCIMSIDIYTKKLTKLNTKLNFMGIAFGDGKLLTNVFGSGIVSIDATNGKSISTIKINLPREASLTSLKNKLYFCNPIKNIISCFDMKGNNIWSFKDDTVIKNPSGIAVDGFGNIYVTNKDLNNVMIISPNGKQRRQLLSESDGLDKPRAIQYDRKQNRLLVANTTGKAFLFDISH